LRVLAKDKSKVLVFRYHKPLAIFATYMVFLHFVSAVADNYKWGKDLRLIEYFGFSFSNEWLIWLSLGTLAFYLMLIIGMTSATKSIQLIGFRRWKVIHYLSYVAFVMAFVHAVNLGTDIKHGVVGTILKPVIIAMFVVVTAFLITRIINSFPVFEDQREVNLAAVLAVLLIVVIGYMMVRVTEQEQTIKALSSRLANEQAILSQKETQILELNKTVEETAERLREVSGG